MFQIARIAKLGTAGEIAASAGHTFRERHTPNADPARLRLNTIVGPRSAAALGQKLAEHLVGIKKGKDELLVTQLYIAGHPGNAKDGPYRSVTDKKESESITVPFEKIKDSKLGELGAKFDIVLGKTPEMD